MIVGVTVGGTGVTALMVGVIVWMIGVIVLGAQAERSVPLVRAPMDLRKPRRESLTFMFPGLSWLNALQVSRVMNCDKKFKFFPKVIIYLLEK